MRGWNANMVVNIGVGNDGFNLHATLGETIPAKHALGLCIGPFLAPSSSEYEQEVQELLCGVLSISSQEITSDSFGVYSAAESILDSEWFRLDLRGTGAAAVPGPMSVDAGDVPSPEWLQVTYAPFFADRGAPRE